MSDHRFGLPTGELINMIDIRDEKIEDLEKENEKMKAVFYELLNLSHHGIDEESWRIRDVLGLKGNI